MSYLLVRHFGDAGKSEARKLLERRADKRERLLGAFNEPMDDWVDFFTYTAFLDRVGMYQLKMLSFSSFGPLSHSMGPMLNEESYHLLTGLTGLRRILRAGRVSVDIVQKVFNRWLPQCFDLFGHERSWGAAKAYRWGLKGRFNEPGAGLMDDAERLNDTARELYRKEVRGLVDVLNKEIGEDQPKLCVPDIKFRRAIGDYKDQRFSVRGKALSEQAYRMHLKEVLPTRTDREKLRRLTKAPDWIAPTF
jgi:benzoyl-CoA 2,3-dioxygenase component B